MNKFNLTGTASLAEELDSAWRDRFEPSIRPASNPHFVCVSSSDAFPRALPLRREDTGGAAGRSEDHWDHALLRPVRQSRPRARPRTRHRRQALCRCASRLVCDPRGEYRAARPNSELTCLFATSLISTTTSEHHSVSTIPLLQALAETCFRLCTGRGQGQKRDGGAA